MLIAVDQLIDTETDIDDDQLNAFVDAFIALVESFGYGTDGAFELATDDKVNAKISRQVAERDFCSGITTAQLEAAGKNGGLKLVEAIRATEWFTNDYSDLECPWCGGYYEHRADCQRQAAFAPFEETE